MGSASVLSNYPAKYSSGQDIEHVGSTGTAMMPFSEALNVSYNIPAYWTYQTILNKGKSVEPYMTKMGYDIADYSVESLPLGGELIQRLFNIRTVIKRWLMVGNMNLGISLIVSKMIQEM